MNTTKQNECQEIDTELEQKKEYFPQVELDKPSMPQAPLIIDLQVAGQFMERFGKGPHTYLTVDDKKLDKSLTSKDWFGSFPAYANRLIKKNMKGGAAWFGVNECKSPKRNNENITKVRAIPFDLDGSPLEPILNAAIQPHIILESSPGKYQGHYFVDCCPLEQFRPIVLAWAKKFSGDVNIANLCQIMRIPGFYHHKGDPFRVRVHSEHFEPPYKTSDIIEKLGLTIEEEAKTKVVTHRTSRPRRSDPADESERNQKLISYAGELENKNLTYDEILERLRQANARYNPPETDEWVVARANSTLKWRAERVAKLDKLYEQLKTAKQADRINLIQDPDAKEALRLCEVTDPAKWFTIRTELFKGCATELRKAVSTRPIPVLAPPSGVKILKEVPGCPEIYPGDFEGYPTVDKYFFQQTDKGVGLFYHASEEHQDEVSHTPVFITKRLVQADRSTYLKAEWLQQGRWKHTTAARADFFNSNKIIELANDGFPVGSDNSKPLSRYLREFEATHLDLIPEQKISFQNGWVGNSFLLGNECISSDGTIIEFQAQSDGEAAAIGALKTDGAYDKWVDGVKAVSHFPLPMIGLYASLGTALIKVVQGPSFIIDFSGLSSTGKTILLRLAASVWGQPNEAISPSITRTWNTTSVAAENLSSLFSDMPLILDDTKQAVNPERIIKFILYGIAGGQGRSRGSKTGLRENKSMRTILISCGESPLDSYRKDGGVRARTLLFTCYPFGAADETSEKIVDTLKTVVFDNYGFAGPMFVRWLIDNIDRWPEFKSRYNEIKNTFNSNGGVIARLSQYCALISIAGELAHEALNLPWEFADPMIKIWPQLVAEAKDADVCDRGAMTLYDYAVSHPSEFYNKLDDHHDAKNPKTKWSGRWDKTMTTDEWTHIDFIQSAMNIICKNEGFDTGSEIANGLIAKKTGIKTCARIGDSSVTVFRIYRGALVGDQSGSCSQCARDDCDKEPYEWSAWAERCLRFIPKVGD